MKDVPDTSFFHFGDIVAIGVAVISSAFSYGALHQRVKTVEKTLDSVDIIDITTRLVRLEEGMKTANTILAEIRSAMIARPQ